MTPYRISVNSALIVCTNFHSHHQLRKYFYNENFQICNNLTGTDNLPYRHEMNHIPYAIDNAALLTLVHVLPLIQTGHHHTLTAGGEPPLISDGGLGRLGKSLLNSDIIIDGKTF